jgi:small subunit ribosomal protein S17
VSEQAPKARRGRATKVGVVTSDAMDKSVVVRVERLLQHPRYKRYVRRSAKFMAHDETNACKVGDTVEIVESRPLSARKCWRVRRVMRTAVGSSVRDERVAEP